MKITYPDFYNEFKCIASACSDSCCIGWEVDIDPFTMSIYENAEGEFGEVLRANIAHDECDHFILKGERCPFLNGKNLCEIFINMGEDKLCDICSDHPRFYEWFGDRTEKGLGLCCEEVCRLLFEKGDKLGFVTEENDEEDEDVELDPELYTELLTERKGIIALLQNRDLSVKERALTLIGETEKTDGKEALKAVLGFYLGLEGIDGNWQKTLKWVLQNIEKLPEADASVLSEVHYEHFLVYLVYRYYMKAVFDGCVWEKLALAISALVALRAADLAVLIQKGSFTFSDRVINAKGFSKDVEYSGDNLAAFEEAAENLLTPEILSAAIEYLF